MPAAVHGSPILLLLGIGPLILMAFWLIRVRYTGWYRPGPGQSAPQFKCGIDAADPQKKSGFHNLGECGYWRAVLMPLRPNGVAVPKPKISLPLANALVRRPPPRARLAALAGAGLSLLSGCAGRSVLAPEGPIAAANRTILLNALAIMLAIVIPTLVATLAFAWWFRAGNKRARFLPDFVYSGRIEMIVWSIPILVILFLGGVIWIGSHALDPSRPIPSRGAPVEVQVVSLDWKWLFIYRGQGVASVNRLVVPAGMPVHFSLTSASVMNAFFVPQLGSMIYTMNGMSTGLNLRADRPGVYSGQSAQFSGDGFADMNFETDAVPAAQFDAWVARVRGGGPALDAAAYRALARQSRHVRPFTYRAVQAGLYEAIVAQRLPPAPGPRTGRGGPQISPREAG